MATINKPSTPTEQDSVSGKTERLGGWGATELPRPSGVNEKRIYISYVASFIVFHLLALLGFCAVVFQLDRRGSVSIWDLDFWSHRDSDLLPPLADPSQFQNAKMV